MGRSPWNQQVLQALSPGPAGQKVQRRALLGTFVLAFLLLWWSDWDWWPTVLWFLFPLVVVILPGIRRLVDETWGLVVGFVLAALMLMPEVPGALVALAWGLAIAATASVSIRRHRFGWRKWVPIIALALGGVLIILGGLAWWAGEQDRQEDAARQVEEAHRYQLSKMLPTPRGAVLNLIEGVVVPEKREGMCFAFSPAAEQQFAQDHGAADCPSALANMQHQVTDVDAYLNYVWIPSQAETLIRPGHERLDACHLEFSSWLTGGTENPGPQIGVLEFQQQYANGWLITRYEPCP